MISKQVSYFGHYNKHRHMNNRIRASYYGVYVAVITSFIALVTFVIALFTPPVSGPFCRDLCIQYPFTESVSRFPRDYFWMYPAILMILAYLILMTCIRYYAPGRKRIFGQLGIIFAISAAVILIANYFIQVFVIQASLIHGETEGVALFSQYNPHGVFIALEEIGFLLMSISFVIISPVFRSTKKLEKFIRLLFIVSFVLACISLVLISIIYGIHREYRFEVAVITINWTTLIIAGILLSLHFKRKVKKSLKK